MWLCEKQTLGRGSQVNGVRHGSGKYTWSNGASYDGHYVEARREGKGTMVYPDKSEYVGMFKDNSPEGKGTYTYPNGDLYHGTWTKGTKDGKGTYVFKDSKSQYLGEWKDGVFTNGMWVAQDGAIFKGDFKDSVPAKGTHYFATSHLKSSGKYDAKGNWKGGKFEAGTAQQVIAGGH